MEMTVALFVFGVLLAIALAGLAISNRQARQNDASRHAGGATVHPHDQRIAASADQYRDRL